MEKLKEHSELGPGPSNQQASAQQLSLANIPKQGSNIQLQPFATATNRVVLFHEDEQNRKLGWYTEEQLKTNPNLLFLFGDNDKAKYRTDNSNPGGSGQAEIARPYDRLPDKGGINGNAVGITTTFFDGYIPNIDEFKVLIDGEFQPIETWVKKGGSVVIPCNSQGKHSLGTGIAKLEDKISGSIEYIQSKIDELVRLGKQTEQSLPDFQELKRDLHQTLSRDGKRYEESKGMEGYLSRHSPFQQQPQRKRTRADSEESSQGDGDHKKSRISSHQAAQVPRGIKRSHSDGESELESSQPENQLYRASGLKHSHHGAIYQLKLLMLFVNKGIDEKYSFGLATEMDAAEKFDDLVFRYKRDKGDGTGRETVWRFLQAKHKQDESEKITVGDLLTDAKKGEFKLDKYFVSYLRINKNQEFQDGYREDFIICTNIGLDLEGSVKDKVRKFMKPHKGKNKEKEISVELVDTNDPFLDLGSGARYKLKNSKNIVLCLKQSDQVKEEIRGQDIDIDKEIEEFLEKLVFAVDQPNEVELDKIMQNTISKEFSRRFNYFGDNESAYNSLLKGMLDWMKKKEGRFLSPEEGKAFFKEAERLASTFGRIEVGVEKIEVGVEKIEVGVEKIELGVEENNMMLKEMCKVMVQPKESNVENAACGLGITKHYYIPRTFTRPIVKNECFKADIADLFLISDMEENELSRLIREEEKIRKFTDKDPDETKPIRFIILNDCFKQLCKKYQRYNIHWLKKEDNQLIWQYSQGDLSKLRAFVDETKKKTMKDINKITDIKDKVVIISAGPGMGKSTLLTHLAEEQIRTSGYLLKVVRINLNDHTDKISKTNFNQEERVIEFLQGIEPELEEPPYSKFNRVALLFDGFDEMSPDYKEKIIKMLQILKDTKVKKLWVTTRPHMRNELEDKLCVFSYTLEPFSRENQEEYLEKFWKSNLNFAISFEKIRKLVNKIGKCFDLDVFGKLTDEISNIIGLPMELSDLEKIRNLIVKIKEDNCSNQEQLFREIMKIIDERYKISEAIKSIAKEVKDIDTLKKSKNSIQERAKVYAVKLVEKFSNSLHDKEREFTGIPLQTRMLAEAFQGNFETFYSSGQRNPYLPNNLDLLNLYEHFIRSKYEVYFRDKMKTGKMSNPAVIEFLDSNIRADSKDYGKLALRILFSNREVGSFVSDIEVGGIQLIKLQRIGIIQLVNNKPSFVHRTFAEYFTANLFADILMGQKYRKKYKAVCCFLRKQIFKTNNEVVRNLLDRKLADKNEIHTATLNNDANAVSDLLSRDNDSVNSIDKQGRTALHLAVIYGYKKIVEILLEHNAAVDIADYTFGWRPLSYADKVSEWSGERSVVELLLQKGANGADMYEAIQGIKVTVIDSDGLLHIAAQGGYIEFAKVLVQNGANVNDKDNNGKTPLHKAAELARLSVVQYLVENGADFNAKDCEGCTPLHLVAKFGSAEVAKYLVDKGADFKLQDYEGYTTQHKAAESGKFEVVKYFVDKWAEWNTPANNGSTPIHKATQSGNLEVVKYLIYNGANVNVADKKGIIPFHIAASIGDLSIIQYFVEEKSIDIDSKDNNGQTSLHKAVYHGKRSVVEYLVGKGANLGAKDKDACTVLHLAASSGELSLVKYLIKMHADLNAKDKNDRTPLDKAAESGKHEAMAYLLENNADYNVSDALGCHPLHMAVRSGNMVVITLLIDKGVNVNTKDSYGDTPLHIAAESGKWNIVKHLIDEGADFQDDEGVLLFAFAALSGNLDMVKYLIEKADVNAVDEDFNTLLNTAIINGDIDVVKFLIEKGADISGQIVWTGGGTSLHLAAVHGQLEIVKYLIEEKSNDLSIANEGTTPLHFFNVVDEEGMTPLYCSAFYGEWDIVKFLVEKGGNSGKTPLHCAAIEGGSDIVEFLVENGANLNVSDQYGKTPLHCAANKDKWDIIQFLVEKGADVNAQDKDGCTVLYIATMNGDLDLVRFLIEKGATINAQIKDGWTPLHRAAFDGALAIVKYLIEEKSTDLSIANKGNSLLHNAAKNGKWNIVKYLFEKGAYAIEDKGLLHIAAQAGHTEFAKVLVQSGVNVNDKDNNGKTPLHKAAELDRLSVVEYLVENDADLNGKDNDGCAPLHLVAEFGSIEVVKYLIEKGANLNVADKKGIIPFHIAASVGNLSIVQYFVEQNSIDIESKDNNGQTSLHKAIYNGKQSVVEYLVDKDANLDAKDKDDSTVLHLAASSGKLSLVKYLIKMHVNLNAKDKNDRTPLDKAVEFGQHEVMAYLLENNADYNVSDALGCHPLHLAVRSGKMEVITLLIDKGVNVNTKDNYGDTPINIAAESGKWNIVKHLIDKGATFADFDYYGPVYKNRDIMHLAVRANQWDIVKQLINKGADFKNCHCYVPLNDEYKLLPFVAWSENLDMVKYLIKKLPIVNRWLALSEAVKADEWLMVKHLIDNGVNFMNLDLLNIAAEKGKWDVVMILIEKGSNVNGKDSYGWTLLHRAAKFATLEVVRSLLDKGANCNAKNDGGHTPIQQAAESYRWNVVRCLIDNGADFESSSFAVSNSSKGLTLLEFAAYNGNLDTVEYIINKEDVDGNVVEYNSYPLHFAAMGGNLEVVIFLVKENTDVNTKDNDGCIALLRAVQSKETNLDVVKYLIKRGAEVNARAKDGRTPLHWAAKRGRLDVVEYLVNKGANINIKDNNDKSVLHNAINPRYDKKAIFELVKYLVGRGIDLINAPDKGGRTPLHLVLDSGDYKVNFKVVKYLVEKGADFNVADQFDTTPLVLAARKGEWHIVKFFLKKGADVNARDKDGWTLLYRATTNGDLDLVKFLIEKGADYNAIDKDGRAPLYWAAKNGNLGIVEYLVEEKNVGVNSKDNFEDTSLHIAVSYGKLNVVKYLINHGADFEIADIYGNTPLHSVAQEGYLNVVKLLVEKSAEVNALDAHGSTPLHKAASSGELEVIKYLVEHGANPHIQNKSEKTALNLAQEKLNQDPENDNLKTVTALLFSVTDAPINNLNEQIQSNENQQ